MNKPTICIYDAELRGVDVGVVVEWNTGQPIGHWPMGIDEAAERVSEEYPGIPIDIYDSD